MILSAPSFFKRGLSKKGQVLMISLWILVILTLLAVGIGHRVSLALRLTRYQADKLKALSLAKAVVNKAIALLETDNNDFDSLNESWVNNEDYFKNILLGYNSEGSSHVSYTVVEDGKENTIFGVVDEERKININTAPKGLLVELFNRLGINEPELIADEVLAWRGDATGNVSDYQDLGYANKGAPFANLQELLLVKDVNQESYDKFKDYLTIWGEAKVNLNTADTQILEALVDFAKKNIGVGENDPEDLIERLIKLRFESPFASFNDLILKLNNQRDLTSGQRNILNRMQSLLTFKSTCFYIIGNGKMKKNDFSSSIQCVFDRAKAKIVYWHEN